MTTLSLEASKKVFELIGLQDTQKCWCKSVGKPWNDFAKDTWNLQYDGWEENQPNSTEQYPAYNFAELIRVLPRIGEKKGWGDSHPKQIYTVNVACDLMNFYTGCYGYKEISEPEGMAEVEKMLMTLI